MIIQKKPDYLIFADSAKKGEVTDFPDVSRGWGITIDQTASKPPMEWMNGAFNRIDKNILYLLQQGVPEWSELVTYPENAIIKYNGALYIAIVKNDNAQPSSDTSKWQRLQADYFNALPAQKIMNGSDPIYEVGEHVDFKERPTVNNRDLICSNDYTGSFNKNGYIKLPSGLVIQWGESRYSQTAGVNGYIQSFHTAFPHTCFLVMTSDRYYGANSTSAHPISASQFRCWGRCGPSEYADTDLFYIALGF
ncbi:gp53-like domain-containing protein [Gilliamella sp. wkB308]|uniref:gp53-like domain-containing protein n=2 Tax=Gilliamella sp. wkB308 TaxID=3120263 RepID=UPI00080E777E|nr:hypothetical protein [Gilliamella apicola]OCF99959.1 hypothetical protein A9G10_04640 [Gilliamella apicola]